MERTKLLIAIGLCVALMMFPLAGMAGNPLPISNSADGHPWDDGDNTIDPDNPGDSLLDVTDMAPGIDITGKPKKSSLSFMIVWKWYLIVIW